MTKNAKVAMGIFGALAAGVLIGMLVAPEKGKDLRLKIKKNADKLTDQLSHLLKRSHQDDLKTGIGEIKEKINRAKEAVS